MKPGGAKEKGREFESTCCRLMQGWWGTPFKRVPLSGGWDKQIITGDIFAVNKDGVDKSFPFSVECKKQEGWNLFQLLDDKGPILQWWKQCTDDCPPHKLPLLMFACNYRSVLVMVGNNLLTKSCHPELLYATHPTTFLWTERGTVLSWTDFTTTLCPKKLT